MLPRVLACLLAVLALGGNVAAAQPVDSGSGLPLRLTVDAPAGCVDGPGLLARVRSYAPRVREAVGGEAARAIRVDLEADGSSFHGALTVREADGAEGHRELRGRDCESVAAGLAFVAAVIMDPDAARAFDRPAAARGGDATSPPALWLARVPTSAPPAGSSAPREPVGRLSAGAAIEVAHGLGPDPETIARLFVDFEPSRWLKGASVRLEVGRGFAPSVQNALGSATIALTDARFEPCLALWAPDPFVLRGCGVVEGLLLSGQGKTEAATTTTRNALYTAELGLALRPTWTIGKRISLGLLVGGAVPFARYRFYFTSPDTTVYELPWWSAFGELSLGVYFW
jgi:hypothetical protein